MKFLSWKDSVGRNEDKKNGSEKKKKGKLFSGRGLHKYTKDGA